METQLRLRTGTWVCPGVGIPKWDYTRVFEYALALGSPKWATYRRLDSQLWLPTGDGSHNRCYTQVCGFLTGATHGCLSVPRRSDPQPGLHTGVRIPQWRYTQVFGFPTGATHVRLDSQPALRTGVWSPDSDPASRQCEFRCAQLKVRIHCTCRSIQ